jgi:hypothetical protein
MECVIFMFHDYISVMSSPSLNLKPCKPQDLMSFSIQYTRPGNQFSGLILGGPLGQMRLTTYQAYVPNKIQTKIIFFNI